MRDSKPGQDTEIKILLVDDDQGFLERTKAFWESEAKWTTVETTAEPEEALEKIRNADHDALVAVHELFGMTRLELLETIRERCVSTPFVVLTGAGSEEIASKALNLRADRYITKDIEPERQLEGIMTAIFDRPVEQTSAPSFHILHFSRGDTSPSSLVVRLECIEGKLVPL